MENLSQPTSPTILLNLNLPTLTYPDSYQIDEIGATTLDIWWNSLNFTAPKLVQRLDISNISNIHGIAFPSTAFDTNYINLMLANNAYIESIFTGNHAPLASNPSLYIRAPAIVSGNCAVVISPPGIGAAITTIVAVAGSTYCYGNYSMITGTNEAVVVATGYDLKWQAFTVMMVIDFTNSANPVVITKNNIAGEVSNPLYTPELSSASASKIYWSKDSKSFYLLLYHMIPNGSAVPRLISSARVAGFQFANNQITQVMTAAVDNTAYDTYATYFENGQPALAVISGDRTSTATTFNLNVFPGFF